MVNATIDSIRLNLQKLELHRNFYNADKGKFTASKVIYTTEHTCLHTDFDYTSKNVYQCRECSGMIFLNQINN